MSVYRGYSSSLFFLIFFECVCRLPFDRNSCFYISCGLRKLGTEFIFMIILCVVKMYKNCICHESETSFKEQNPLLC